MQIEPSTSQLEIRDAPELGLLITAPAGCGKTEALALRLQGLVRRGIVTAPHKVLVVTFTNRARDNIRERLSAYLRQSEISSLVTIQNLHGLATRIVHAHGNVIGVGDDWEASRADWVTDQCRSYGLNSRQSSVVKEHLQSAKLEDRTDEEVAEYLARTGHRIAIAIEKKRVEERILTYDDLPRLASLILRNRSVAELYRQHFVAVIVDEFQDLSKQQLRIVQRIGAERTTFAGDLAQGIYGFAGADPQFVLEEARKVCSREIVFADSHRSSPAVLDLVNALSPLTGGVHLNSSRPDSWPSGGLTGHHDFESVEDEATWVLRFATNVHRRAPRHRIGVIARTKYRRAAVEVALIAGSPPFDWYRWDDPIFDSEAAPLLRSALRRASAAALVSDESPAMYLQSLVPEHALQDPSTRDSVVAGCLWAEGLLADSVPRQEIIGRIKVGEDETLLTAPGVHLLTGHAGKGQQFDWVIVLGLESDSIPGYQATTADLRKEEARVLAVMLSRARHGALTTRSHTSVKPWGDVVRTAPSAFAPALAASKSYRAWHDAKDWLESVHWDELAVH